LRLSFKEMCARFGVTPRTLRHYEYVELLAPGREGGARAYSLREVARMTLVLSDRRFGVSLEEIRQWPLLYEQAGTRAQLERFLEMIDRQLAALEEQRRHLDETIDELARLRAETAASLPDS
jgi:DNA-binding transcriptional MerR regulator